MLLWLGLGAAFTGLFLVFGLGGVAFGYNSARNAHAAANGEDTTVAHLRDVEGLAFARLEATVTDVPDPVETADGEQVAVYRAKAVLRNFRNLVRNLGRRMGNLSHNELLSDAVELDAVEVHDDSGGSAILAAPDDGFEFGGWGQPQSRDTQVGAVLTENHFVTGEWTRRRTFTDDGAVPEPVRDHLAARDVDTDFGLGRIGVRGLVFAEDVVEAGDEVQVAGPVRCRPDGDGEPGDTPRIDLTHRSTVTADGWGALARDEGKAALVQLPVGLFFVGTAVVVGMLALRNAGLL